MSILNRETVMAEIDRIFPEVVSLRRHIHEYPELGNEEHKTSALIADTLASLGFEVTRPMGTSVVALLRGGRPGKTVAFRSDMDALPVQEETGLPYESKVPGKMHACGHDIHMAGLLGLAMVLAAHKDELNGNVKLFFQPDEEGYGGARRMIEAGCMANPDVDAVFGAHISPKYPSGTIAFKSGKFYAAADIFRVVVTGQGCHGASPQDGIDPIAVASQIVCGIQQIISRRISPLDSAVITIGSFHAGTARNIIPDEAVLDGVIRTLGAESREYTKQVFIETCEGIAKALGATARVEMSESYPGVVNDPAMTDFARAAATDLLGSEYIHIIETPTMVTEDFGFFLDKVPGTFYEVGVAAPGELSYPLHNAHLAPDESAIRNLIAAHVATATAFLNRS